MLRFVKATIFTTLLAGTVPASAATVLTFDGPSDVFTPYKEAGFVIDDDGVNIPADGSLHIDIYYGPNANFRTIKREDDGAFDVHGLDIVSLYPNVFLGGLIGPGADDMRFEGFRNGTLVAQTTASSQFGDVSEMFGSTFKGITSFTITGFDAGNLDLEQFRDVHFLIDNLIVSGAGDRDDPIALVPLPAAGGLLLIALVSVSLCRKQGVLS